MLITAPLIVKTGLFVDDIQRPLLDFYENLGQIFPYNPQRHQLHAGKNRNDRYQRSPADNCAPHRPAVNDETEKTKAQEADEKTHKRYQSERHNRKT